MRGDTPSWMGDDYPRRLRCTNHQTQKTTATARRGEREPAPLSKAMRDLVLNTERERERERDRQTDRQTKHTHSPVFMVGLPLNIPRTCGTNPYSRKNTRN